MSRDMSNCLDDAAVDVVVGEAAGSHEGGDGTVAIFMDPYGCLDELRPEPAGRELETEGSHLTVLSLPTVRSSWTHRISRQANLVGSCRLQGNSYAPRLTSWGVYNRAVALPVPAVATYSHHIEHRSASQTLIPFFPLQPFGGLFIRH